MTAPERHLPTATTRAIVRENLVEHLMQAGRRTSAILGELPREVVEGVVAELIDVAFRIEHQPRGDRIRVTLNPPPVGTPLPVAVVADAEVRVDGFADVGHLAGDGLVTGGARAEQARVAAEVTADGSTVLPPDVDLGGNATPEPPYPGMVSDGRGNWYSPEEAAARGVTARVADAVPNGQGGWAISEDDAEEIRAAMGDDPVDDDAATGDTTATLQGSGKPRCQYLSEGVQCRYQVHGPETDHAFGGGMGDPVHLHRCADITGEHPAHAWRDGNEKVWACSGGSSPFTPEPDGVPSADDRPGDFD